MKSLLKRLLLACPGFAPWCRLLTRGHVRTLMYHRFTADASPDGRAVDAARLREQLALLRRHHDLWRPDDHLDLLAGRRGPGRCPVVVTADDGYADFHAVAFPLFREYGVPAVLFLTTGFVDGTTWFWWDRLAWLLAAASGRRGTVDLGDRAIAYDLTAAAGRTTAWHRIADRCRFLDDARKEAVLRGLADELGVALPDRPPPQYAPVTWDQVREMAAAGIVLGAHTMTHPILSRVSAAEAAAEIAGARRRLAEATGLDTVWFCYPQGGPADFTPAVQAAVREAGYRGCYVAWQSMAVPPDPYALPRSCMTADLLEFRWTLCGAEWLLLRLRRRLGLRTEPGASYWAGAE